jgi:hypothetical protein
MTVRIAIALTTVAALVAFPFNGLVAQGIAMGGIGGTVAFWLFAYRMEKFAVRGEGSLAAFAMRWSFIRLGIYAAVLVRAVYLDMEHFTALLGAVGGLFITRMALVFLAFTGLDLKQGES